MIAAAVLSTRGVLLVSKQAAPEIFYLPGGKPEPGEMPLQCLGRELNEELGVALVAGTPLLEVHADAALERRKMHMSVFQARLRGTPTPQAEIAELAWWPEHRGLRLATAVRDVVIPHLEQQGLLRRNRGVVVRRVSATETAALRAEVLRPGQTTAAVPEPGDDHPDTWHFAAVSETGRVLSTVNVRPSPPPWEPLAAGWWHLRGLATAVHARDHGHARSVLGAAIEQADRIGAHVWANARVDILGLYGQFGFTPLGDLWPDPVTGSHRSIVRTRRTA